jgi:hypothetical protein
MGRLLTLFAIAGAALAIAAPALAASSAVSHPTAKTGGSPAAGPPRPISARPLNATINAVCDADGPCLHTTNSAAGTPVNMYTFQPGDPFENLNQTGDAGDYGCTYVQVTPTPCPFHDRTLDQAFRGDVMVRLQFTGLAGQPCVEAYPGNDLHVESCSTAPDRRVFIQDGHLASPTVYISPYWTNAGNCGSAICVLYGPPINQTASVNTWTDNTRQIWHRMVG